MINENDPAAPVGAWGQQSTEGETILMKYSAMFLASMVRKKHFFTSAESERKNYPIYAINLAKTLIAELNKESEPIKES